MPRPRKGHDSKSKSNEPVVFRFFERLVPVLLRLGLDSPRAESLIRQAFVLEAAKYARQVGGRTTQSQIALIAGVNRLDVRTIIARNIRHPSATSFGRQSRVQRILNAWRQDPEFANKQGRPKPLTFTGKDNQFAKLVRKYGRDVTVRTLREDLIKSKIASTKGIRLVLKKTGNALDTSSIAAQADLNFLDSQLAQFDFSRGRRSFLVRNLSLTTGDLRLLKLAQRKAIGKIDAVLGSLESLQRNLLMAENTSGRRAHRLRVTTILSTESNDAIDRRSVIHGSKG